MRRAYVVDFVEEQMYQSQIETNMNCTVLFSSKHNSKLSFVMDTTNVNDAIGYFIDHIHTRQPHAVSVSHMTCDVVDEPQQVRFNAFYSIISE